MSKVYLAIPYSHDNEDIMRRRFEFVTRLAGIYAERGLVPFSPITHSHTMAEKRDMPTDWEFWRDQDVPFLDWADELYVVKAKGWRESTGVNAETNLFGGNIEYINPVKTDAIDIVGISGKKRSGKDTAAEILTENYGFESYSLADPMKEAARAIFMFGDEQLYGDRKEKVDEFWDLSPREVLQNFGTDLFREKFGEEVWLDSMERRLSFYLPEKVVIPDIRFPNEADWVKNMGGEVVRIDASERLESDDDHASETALDDYDGFDYVIDNNGTLPEFRMTIHDLADQALT